MSEHFTKFTEVLKLESAAIDRAAANLNADDVDRAIEILTSCRGKIIVAGVGKSGVIAEKIAQTLTSTGTVAVFVHPSDAIHGGLGVIEQNDVVIAVEQLRRNGRAISDSAVFKTTLFGHDRHSGKHKFFSSSKCRCRS